MDIDRDLILKYLDGTLSPEESRKLLEWVKASKENEEMLFSVKESLLALDYERDSRNADTARECCKFMRRIGLPAASGKTKRWRTFAVSAAAVMAGIILGGAGMHLLKQNAEKTVSIETGVGQQATATLPDGSKVTLNSCSMLSYGTSKWGRERTVTLDGEASFDVARNPKLPFSVRTQSFDVVVLGTTFNVSAYSADSLRTVALKTGEVGVSFKGGETARLNPGQTCLFNTRSSSYRIEETDPERTFAWERNMLYFENTVLESMVPQLQRHYGYTFVLSDDVKSLSYRATITDESLTEFLAILESVTPQLSSRIDKDSRTVYLSSL